jgi:hypothetical protein
MLALLFNNSCHNILMTSAYSFSSTSQRRCRRRTVSSRSRLYAIPTVMDQPNQLNLGSRLHYLPYSNAKDSTTASSWSSQSRIVRTMPFSMSRQQISSVKSTTQLSMIPEGITIATSSSLLAIITSLGAILGAILAAISGGFFAGGLHAIAGKHNYIVRSELCSVYVSLKAGCCHY